MRSHSSELETKGGEGTTLTLMLTLTLARLNQSTTIDVVVRVSRRRHER